MTVQQSTGGAIVVDYDALLIASGVTNGFWRNTLVETRRDIQHTVMAQHAQVLSLYFMCFPGFFLLYARLFLMLLCVLSTHCLYFFVQIAKARTVAVVGGGLTGVSAAYSIQRRFSHLAVHLFFSRTQVLPGYCSELVLEEISQNKLFFLLHHAPNDISCIYSSQS